MSHATAGMLPTVVALVHWLVGAAEIAAAVTVVRRPRRPGLRPLAVLLAALGTYTAGFGFEILHGSVPWMLGWLRVEYVGIPLVGWAWWWLGSEVATGHSRAPRSLIWLAVLPALVIAVALAGGGARWIHAPPHAVHAGPVPIFLFRPGPMYRAIWVFNWVLVAVGTVRMGRAAALHRGAYQRQLRLWLLAVAVPAVANLAYAAGLRLWGGFDLNPLAFAVGAAVLAPTIQRRSILDVVPIARARALDVLREGVIVFDAEDRVLDANPAAISLLGPAAVGRAGPEAFPLAPEFGRVLKCDRTNGGDVLPGTGPRRRTIEWRQQPIGDPEAPDGRVVWLRDVTEEHRMAADLRAQDRLLAALGRSARMLLAPAGVPELRAYLRELGDAASVERLHLILGGMPPHMGTAPLVEVARWDAAQPTSVGPESPRPLQPAEAEVADRWLAALRGGQSIGGIIDDFAPPDRAWLDALGLSGAVAAPIVWGEHAGGFLLLGLVRERRSPTPAEIEFIHSAALHIALALRRDLMEAAAEEARRIQSIGRFAAGVARDFNNLNQVILGYTEAIRSTMAADDARRADLGEVEEAGRRAVQLTRQLLAAGASQLVTLKPTDVHPLLQRIAPMIVERMGASIDVELRLTAAEDHVLADASLIESSILGLVANARDAMPLGGHLTLGTRNIEVSGDLARLHALEPGRYLGIDVTDNGVGMSDQVRAHLFELFFTTKPRGQSTGLGLAAILGTLKQHGGDVWVESVEGQGSTFTLVLPVQPAEEPPADRPAVSAA